MKPGGVSSLNPYAAEYIPLSRRQAEDATFARSKESNRNNDAVWFGGVHQTLNQNQTESRGCYVSDCPGTEALLSPKAYALNSYPPHDSYGSSSRNVNEGPDNEEFDMDLEYLQMLFPGVSVQSLDHVYMVNERDVDATIDKLNQLELSVESSESLPDTLDIGDVSESGISPNSTWKLKNVAAGQASGLPRFGYQ